MAGRSWVMGKRRMPGRWLMLVRRWIDAEQELLRHVSSPPLDLAAASTTMPLPPDVVC
jgi:hypothetical protein